MSKERAADGVRCGRLVIVATPIGNLADLAPRARDALAAADVVAAEDTRRSGQLLAALGLQKKPMVSLHAHNERERGDALLARLQAGEAVALVSDAGTPLLSDPGYDLVRRAALAGIEVTTVPGLNVSVPGPASSTRAENSWPMTRSRSGSKSNIVMPVSRAASVKGRA